jgi:voltage-gated potassium channel
MAPLAALKRIHDWTFTDREVPMPSAARRWQTLRELDSWLQTPMIVLSLTWLVLVVVELTSGSSQLLETIGTAIWIIFIVEFLLRLTLAPDKSAFLKSNWLTIVALVVPAFRLFRAVRLFRAARALRGVRLVRVVGTANRSMNALKAALSRRGFGYVGGLTLLVLVLGAAGMLNFEGSAEVEGGFRSYLDALWWTGMLLTSIGSDFWPQTTEGRVLTMLLSIYGLAVFGYITAAFASFFVGRDAEERSGPIAGQQDIMQLIREVEALRMELRERSAQQRH